MLHNKAKAESSKSGKFLMCAKCGNDCLIRRVHRCLYLCIGNNVLHISVNYVVNRHRIKE